MSEVARLQTGHVDALRELLRICWLDTYTGILSNDLIRVAAERWHSRESLLRGLSNPRAYYGGLFEAGALRGMVAAAMADDITLGISQLYVHPSQQRKGVGRRLMDAAIDHFPGATKVVLEVEEENSKGVAFYKKYGFSYPRKTTLEVGDFEIPCLVGEMEITQKWSRPSHGAVESGHGVALTLCTSRLLAPLHNG